MALWPVLFPGWYYGLVSSQPNPPSWGFVAPQLRGYVRLRILFIFNFLKDFIYLFDREREWEGAQAAGDAGSLLSREPYDPGIMTFKVSEPKANA